MAYVENVLISLFSLDTGLSDDGIARQLEQIRTNSDSRERAGIKAELENLYTDSATNWINLLENDDYEVYPASSQDDGKRFITERLWNVLFPDERR